jgi:hypothetical protein
MRLRALVVLALTALSVMPASSGGQAASAGDGPQTRPSDAAINQAATAIERAEGYADLVEAMRRYEQAICSPRMAELADEVLRLTTISDAQRGLVRLERQLSIDCRQRGAAVAARLLSVRVIAGYALQADSPQEFAGVLEKFSELARELDIQLVRDALSAPAMTWPPALLPLMEQLSRDWREQGALAAATRMASAATGPPAAAQPAAPATVPVLTGHWRSTRIAFDSPTDEHVVLHADGSAETWTVTASSRSPVTRGRWRNQGSTLNVDWADGRQWSQPFTFYQGQLVFPNVPNRRQFWEAIN